MSAMRVLLVESTPGNAALVKKRLEAAGHQVEAAGVLRRYGLAADEFLGEG